VVAIGMQLIVQFTFMAYVDGQLRGMNCDRLKDGSRIEALCEGSQGLPWYIWFIFVVYALSDGYFIPLILYYTRQRVDYLRDREDDLVSHASGIFFDSNGFNKHATSTTGTDVSDRDSHTSMDNDSEPGTSVTKRKQRKSVAIEDDPFGDNFRASLEDIRAGTRSNNPRTPNMSRFSSKTSHDTILEKPDMEAASASSFSKHS